MPHQCLSCGEAFEDGSTDLLKGCPSCEGTRFFFVEEPLEADQREELKEQADQNVHEMLREILSENEKPDMEQDIWSREAWENWIRMRADEDPEKLLEELEEKGVTFKANTDEQGTIEPQSVQVRLDDVEEASAPDEDETAEAPDPLEAIQAEQAAGREIRPSTLNIVNPGEYEIDVERLMEDSPVIVERDGSYVIHLPSVFEKGARRR